MAKLEPVNVGKIEGGLNKPICAQGEKLIINILDEESNSNNLISKDI